jgi:hypothetical protein
MIRLSFKPKDGLHLAFKIRGSPSFYLWKFIAGADSSVLPDGNELKPPQQTAYKLPAKVTFGIVGVTMAYFSLTKTVLQITLQETRKLLGIKQGCRHRGCLQPATIFLLYETSLFLITYFP